MIEDKIKNNYYEKDKVEPELAYFELQAYWGVSKPHFGGLKATQELTKLCFIDRSKYILDVGCGVGITSCYIAKNYGCKVVGVDISEKMISRAKERAKREGVQDRVEFRIADAQDLPFENGLFEIVISESVTAFIKDKQKAMKEYLRVLKPGGYVGLNEATWIKTPPAELIEYISRITGAEPENLEGWKGLLENSGLKDVEMRIYKSSTISQFVDEISYIGLKDYLRGWYRFLTLYIKSSNFREYLKKAWTPKIVRNMFKYLGYGLYVGRK